MAPPLEDIFETSSFASLIEREEREEIIHLDLHTASLIGDYDCVRGFIERKSNLNHLNRGGWTALMYAAYVGRDNILNLLLEAGAKINIQSKKDGCTALMLASYCASESIMYFLLQHGASINSRDVNGMTSLFHAVKQGHQSAVKLLASNGADLDTCHAVTGSTPLMEAAIAGHEVIFSILLHHGADISKRTKKGETIRSLAVRYGNQAIVTLIDKVTRSTQIPLREEPKLGSGEALYDSGSSDSRESNINEGPSAISNMFINRGMPQGEKPIAALCPDFNNLMAPRNTAPASNEYSTGSDPVNLQMSGVSTTGVEKDSSEMATERYSQKKVSRIASELPKNVFTTQRSLDFLPPPESLKELLEEFKLESYIPRFEQQGIDLTAFLELTDVDLKDMGVEKLGPRKKLIIAIKSCKERLKSTQRNNSTEPAQTDQLQLQIQQLNAQLHEAVAYIKQQNSQLLQAQQYRTDVSNYFQAEEHRMRQIAYCTNDFGKICKEASGQMRKLKEYNNQVSLLLHKLKERSDYTILAQELGIDASLYDVMEKVKCDIETTTGRLDLTYKQVENTLRLAQMNQTQLLNT
ncbi:ankyrin repeat and SAM domain-containing protein 3-like isoform X2 [Hydractinia symbiolongicarpus]|uniref:ankyrin repeat and SAM domain-containing protein 3-like isoform X2 n=1 Tax=Hydractinia symbiolongicarpus TaxID=13093 RepID=UPI00254B4B70|nr:ankyrin repeat and SAM domain-containing protein 3-like isoform X2 [Hydractinia symbiolongicarpus]